MQAYSTDGYLVSMALGFGCAAAESHWQRNSPGIPACAGEAGAKGRRRILRFGVAAVKAVAVVDLAFADSGIGTWQQAVMTEPVA